VEADGVVATHLRLDHTEHALFAVLANRAVEELLFIGFESHVDCKSASNESLVRKDCGRGYAQFWVPAEALRTPDAHSSSSALADLLQGANADERVAVWLALVVQT